MRPAQSVWPMPHGAEAPSWKAGQEHVSIDAEARASEGAAGGMMWNQPPR
jgi:hypothetical protein